MMEYPKAKTIIDEYIRLAQETNINKLMHRPEYQQFAHDLAKSTELVMVIQQSILMGAHGILGLFIDGILIGMALAEKRQLEELAKL